MRILEITKIIGYLRFSFRCNISADSYHCDDRAFDVMKKWTSKIHRATRHRLIFSICRTIIEVQYTSWSTCENGKKFLSVVQHLLLVCSSLQFLNFWITGEHHMETDPSSFSINHNYYLLVTPPVICATPSFTTYCIRHSLLLHHPSIYTYIFILLLVSTGQYCDIFNLLHKKKQNKNTELPSNHNLHSFLTLKLADNSD